MRKTIKVLDVTIDDLTMDEAVSSAIGFFDDGKKHYICTPNPEIVMAAKDDLKLKEILNNADMVVPDGIGVVWASKYSESKLKERVPGFELTLNLFDKLKDTDKKVFFFGGAPGVAEEAAKKMTEKYKGLKIAGTRNGYFNKEEEKDIISEINRSGADLLLVGLGAPKQEKWIYENKDLLCAKVYIGIGGSFDVMAGNVKRAPKVFQRLGLEWFYRLITQPTRFKRMLKLPLFVIEVLKNK